MLISELENSIKDQFNLNKTIIDFKLDIINTIKSIPYLEDYASLNMNKPSFYSNRYDKYFSLQELSYINNQDQFLNIQKKELVIDVDFKKYRFNHILTAKTNYGDRPEIGNEVSFRAAFKKNNVIVFSSKKDVKNTKYSVFLNNTNKLLTNEWPKWHKSCLDKLEPFVWNQLQIDFPTDFDSIELPKRFLKYKIFK